MPIIDAHAHVFASVPPSTRSTDPLAPAERSAPLSLLQQRMRDAGVDGVVVVAYDDQDEDVAALADQPEVAGIVVVASSREQGRTGADPVGALMERRERVPYMALRTSWLGEPHRPLADSPMSPVLAHLEREAIPLWSYLPPEQTSLLEELGQRHPDLVVVLNHLGFAPHDMRVDVHGRPQFLDAFPPSEVDRVERLSRYPGMYLMFSGHYALSPAPVPYTDLHDAGNRLVGAFGPARTIWGSDWPWIDVEPGYSLTLDLVDVALPGLSVTERDALLGGTIARMLSA